MPPVLERGRFLLQCTYGSLRLCEVGELLRKIGGWRTPVEGTLTTELQSCKSAHRAFCLHRVTRLAGECFALSQRIFLSLYLVQMCKT